MSTNLPKMFCITCSQIPWRTDAGRERFKAAGLDVELFNGIHGATAGIAPTLPHFDSPTHFISAGKLGITLSKFTLWNICLHRLESEFLIFEDDVTFTPCFATEFAASYAALPADWDVVHVGHCCGDDKPTTRINDRISEIRHPFCCHAVLWRKRGLEAAVEAIRRTALGTNSDIILAQAVYPQLRHYSFTPPLAFQEPVKSEARGSMRWDGIQGWFDFARIYDEALDRVRGPATFVELGSWFGRSSAYMAEEIKRRLLPVTFFAVDTWRGTVGHNGLQETVVKYGGDIFAEWRKNMSRAGVIDYVTPIQEDSAAAAARFADATVDFVFVDADHSFQAVVNDIRAWRPKLKKHGVIAGHDVDMPDVLRAVQQEFGAKFRTWERCWIAT